MYWPRPIPRPWRKTIGCDGFSPPRSLFAAGLTRNYTCRRSPIGSPWSGATGDGCEADSVRDNVIPKRTVQGPHRIERQPDRLDFGLYPRFMSGQPSRSLTISRPSLTGSRTFRRRAHLQGCVRQRPTRALANVVLVDLLGLGKEEPRAKAFAPLHCIVLVYRPALESFDAEHLVDLLVSSVAALAVAATASARCWTLWSRSQTGSERLGQQGLEGCNSTLSGGGCLAARRVRIQR